MIKWKEGSRYLIAEVGNLYAYIEDLGEDDPEYIAELNARGTRFAWFIAPDDEDKNYRRAFVMGHSPTLDAAKKDCAEAVRDIANNLLKAIA